MCWNVFDTEIKSIYQRENDFIWRNGGHYCKKCQTLSNSYHRVKDFKNYEFLNKQSILNVTNVSMVFSTVLITEESTVRFTPQRTSLVERSKETGDEFDGM